MADNRPDYKGHVIQPTDSPSLRFGLKVAEQLAKIGECCGLLAVLGTGTIYTATKKASELQLAMRDVNTKHRGHRDPKEAMTFDDLRKVTRERLLILAVALEDKK